jgi:HD-GYP domain-containing protein (c-di-GMP phosphodiesterase class II)
MGLSLKDVTILQYSGLLHDIGKIEIPKTILNKTGELTDEEYECIQMHPVFSANILEPLEEMSQLIEHVKHHHERFDGKGYPNGLRGNEISLGARILCVADSFDAMLSERPYSKSMATIEAINELEKCSGTHFDPEIIKVFTRIMRLRLLAS